MAVPFFLLLPLFHAFNPLSIASLVRVVAGLNRCGSFRIQQQVLHSDAGNSVPVFLIEVPLFIRYRLNVRHGIHSVNIVPSPVYKDERVASGMLCHQSIVT